MPPREPHLPDSSSDYYQLLGLAPFETDLAQIDARVREMMREARRYQVGQYAAAAEKHLNLLASARDCQHDSERKREYDEELRVRYDLPPLVVVAQDRSGPAPESAARTAAESQGESPAPEQTPAARWTLAGALGFRREEGKSAAAILEKDAAEGSALDDPDLDEHPTALSAPRWLLPAGFAAAVVVMGIGGLFAARLLTAPEGTPSALETAELAPPAESLLEAEDTGHESPPVAGEQVQGVDGNPPPSPEKPPRPAGQTVAAIPAPPPKLPPPSANKTGRGQSKLTPDQPVSSWTVAAAARDLAGKRIRDLQRAWQAGERSPLQTLYQVDMAGGTSLRQLGAFTAEMVPDPAELVVAQQPFVPVEPEAPSLNLSQEAVLKELSSLRLRSARANTGTPSTRVLQLVRYGRKQFSDDVGFQKKLDREVTALGRVFPTLRSRLDRI